MYRVTSAVFCDHIHELKDGRHLLGPIWPGLVRFETSNGPQLTVCLFLCLKWDEPGHRELDLRITGPDGAVVNLDKISAHVPDARCDVQVAGRNIAVNVRGTGTLAVHLKEGDGDWVEAASLLIEVATAQPPLTATFGYGLPQSRQ